MPVMEVAIVGAGPTASSLLERLAANAPELLGGRPLRVHLIDPHRAGTGRVWRPDLHPGLWMNSMAEDVTMFTDDTVQCDGPIRPGPSLYEWAHTIDDDTLAALAPPALVDEIRALGADDVPDPARAVGLSRLVPPTGAGGAAGRRRGRRPPASRRSTFDRPTRRTSGRSRLEPQCRSGGGRGR